MRSVVLFASMLAVLLIAAGCKRPTSTTPAGLSLGDQPRGGGDPEAAGGPANAAPETYSGPFAAGHQVFAVASGVR